MIKLHNMHLKWWTVVAAVILLTVGVQLQATAVLADTATYTYDPLGRLVQVTYDTGTTIVYTYDAAGNLTNVVVTVEPIISAVTASGVTATGATITWTTDRLADSQVDFGTTTGYELGSVLDPTLVTSHSLPLTGLTASTLYHYRVSSRDAGGSLNISGDFTFSTTP
jgi:YD repeat-containing protein